MRILLFFLLYLFIPFSQILSQRISGQVLAAETGNPVPYASVSWTANPPIGTLSNEDGFFTLLGSNRELIDTSQGVVIQHLGFQRDTFTLLELDNPLLIEFINYELATVEILADDAYLYDLVHECRQQLVPWRRKTGRAYFQMISTTEDHPLELLEAYYNLQASATGIKQFDLKRGRAYLAPLDEYFFVNLGTTQATVLLDLKVNQGQFPFNPLQLNKKKMRSLFRLKPGNAFSKSELLKVIFEPRILDNEQELEVFSGELWIHADTKALYKIIVNGVKVNQHPFRPIWSANKIQDFNLTLAFSFRPATDNGKMEFHFLEWQYDFDLESKPINLGDKARSMRLRPVTSKGVLMCYDYNEVFQLPFYNYSADFDDYRKISLFPPDQRFWERSQGLPLTEQQIAQLRYFEQHGHQLDFTQKGIARKDQVPGSFFEYNNIHWSENLRVNFPPNHRNTGLASVNRQHSPSVVSSPGEPYRIDVQLFLDINNYPDTFHVTTSTVIDVYESHHNFDLSLAESNAMINLYFDLCELQRRELHEEIMAIGDQPTAIEAAHKAAQKKIDQLHFLFFAEVYAAGSQNKLRMYNKEVKEKLGIDNLAFLEKKRQ